LFDAKGSEVTIALMMQLTHPSSTMKSNTWEVSFHNARLGTETSKTLEDDEEKLRPWPCTFTKLHDNQVKALKNGINSIQNAPIMGGYKERCAKFIRGTVESDDKGPGRRKL
jgi:hypothetical protein